MSETIIRVRRDGIVLHKHSSTNLSHEDGRWHGPWETHSRNYGQRIIDAEAHEREGAFSLKVCRSLNKEQRAQYYGALVFSARRSGLTVKTTKRSYDPTKDAAYLAARKSSNVATDLLTVPGF